MPQENGFVSWLRLALRHMYEPSILRRSPLIERFSLSAAADPAAELRQLLVKEIRAMAPQPDTPPDSELWRVHEVLLYRHVQHYSQVEVADQLGLSVRQLRREEHKAIEALAARLRTLLEQQAGSTPARGEVVKREDAGAANMVAMIDGELAWLDHSAPREPISLGQVLPSVLKSIRLLAERYGVEVEMAPGAHEAPPVAAHPVALKQVLLNLLTVAIRVAGQKRVLVSARGVGSSVELHIEAPGLRDDPEHSAENIANIEMARRLMERCHGHVAVEQASEGLMAVAVFPGLEQVPVLIIDDNVDTLRLLQRYATGTRYQILGATDLAQGLAIAEETPPSIIILDVMMPDMDGWEALAQLRQHPLTSHIPIMVCTILSQKELALSLGASGYLSKPISRQTFLDALDQLTHPEAPGPN